MKVSYYLGGGSSIEINFRYLGARAEGSKIVLDGYHTANSTEYKATFEIEFEEALGFIEKLKRQIAEMPCPTCQRR